MVTITRFALNRCNFHVEKLKEQRIIDSVLKIWNDGAIFSQLYKDKKWDGHNRFYDKNNEFDFGLFSELEDAFKVNEVKFEFIDNYNSKIVIDKFNFSEDNRGYQSEAVEAFFEKNIGIVIVPTRGGKTYIASQCIKTLQDRLENQKIIFMVDGVDLFKQTVDEFSNFLKIPKSEIGAINSKEIRLADITVAMIQTLTSIFYGRKKDSKKIRLVNKHLLSVDFLIVDEIQDTSSVKRIRLYNKCKNRKLLLGLSATPYKQNNILSALTVKGFFGGVCYIVPKKRLQKEGFLSIDKAILISNDVVDYSDSDSYQEFLHSCIYDNDKRNMILQNIVKCCEANYWKTLFLFNSKYHGRKLADITGGLFLDGDDGAKMRDLVKTEFLSGKGGILYASNIYKKGITLPEVEIVVLADGGLEGTNVIQKFGRVLGATENKKHSIIIDILDVGSKYFSEHSLNRLEIYDNQIGKKRIEIYGSDDWSEIEETIKDWLNVNK
jgi:superfamily II DNA or RNA helicase